MERPRLILWFGTLLATLLFLSGCSVQFGTTTTRFSNYTRPGVSESQRQAEINQCVFRHQGSAGGGRVGRSMAMRDLRIQDCLARKGYRRG